MNRNHLATFRAAFWALCFAFFAAFAASILALCSAMSARRPARTFEVASLGFRYFLLPTLGSLIAESPDIPDIPDIPAKPRRKALSPLLLEYIKSL